MLIFDKKPKEAELMTFRVLRTKYQNLYDAMKTWHQVAPRPHQGHGLDHDVTVAMLAVKIAPDKHTGEMAFLASLLHSIDRTVNTGDREALSTKLVEMTRLFPSSVSESDREDIVNSVLGHSNLNNDGDSLVQQTLMDADRLANMMKLVIIRAGQFASEIPAIELEYIETPNPRSTYREPCSVLDELLGILSRLPGQVGYIEQIRLPKAIELGKYYYMRLSEDVEMIRQDYRDLGLAGVKL